MGDIIMYASPRTLYSGPYPNGQAPNMAGKESTVCIDVPLQPFHDAAITLSIHMIPRTPVASLGLCNTPIAGFNRISEGGPCIVSLTNLNCVTACPSEAGRDVIASIDL